MKDFMGTIQAKRWRRCLLLKEEIKMAELEDVELTCCIKDNRCTSICGTILSKNKLAERLLYNQG